MGFFNLHIVMGLDISLKDTLICFEKYSYLLYLSVMDGSIVEFFWVGGGGERHCEDLKIRHDLQKSL